MVYMRPGETKQWQRHQSMGKNTHAQLGRAVKGIMRSVRMAFAKKCN